MHPLLVYPALGSVLSHADLQAESSLPAYVAVPTAPREGRQGFLPIACGPFAVEGDPARGNFAVKDLAPRTGLEQVLRLVERADGRGSNPGDTVGAAFPFLPLPIPFPNPSPIQDFGHGNGFGFGDAGRTCVVSR